MRSIVLYVVCLGVQYFSTLSHKRHDFHNKVIEHEMCVLIFCTVFFFLKHFSLQEELSEILS